MTLVWGVLAMLVLYQVHSGMVVVGGGGSLHTATNCAEFLEALDAPRIGGGGGIVTTVPQAAPSAAAQREPPLPAQPSLDFPLPRRIDMNSTTTTASNLVIFVLSRRHAHKVRQAIRDTWGHTATAAAAPHVYFVLGQPCPIPPLFRGVDEGGNSYCQVKPGVLSPHYLSATLAHIAKEDTYTQALRREQDHYGDLLVVPDMVDMYRTLPQKLKYAYRYTLQQLPPHIHWILKVDDDFYVRGPAIQEALRDLDASTPTLISGDIRREHFAHTGGKWKEVSQFPKGGLYPPFPLGSYGHIVSRPIADYVASNHLALFDYQGEDVSLGIWLSHPSAPANTKFVDWPQHMSNGGDCRLATLSVIGHDITPAKMQACHALDQQRNTKQ